MVYTCADFQSDESFVGGCALTRGDIAAIAFVIGLAIVLILLSPIYPGAGRLRANWGFGPDWDCTYPAQGEPVCIKKPPVPAPHPSNAPAS